MAIALTCPHCHTQWEVADVWASQHANAFTCPGCGRTVTRGGTAPAPPSAIPPLPAREAERTPPAPRPTPWPRILGGAGVLLGVVAWWLISSRDPKLPAHGAAPRTSQDATSSPVLAPTAEPKGQEATVPLEPSVKFGIRGVNMKGTLELEGQAPFTFGADPDQTLALESPIYGLPPGEHRATLTYSQSPGGLTAPSLIVLAFPTDPKAFGKRGSVRWEAPDTAGKVALAFTVK